MSPAIVEAQQLGKRYRIYSSPWHRFLGALSRRMQQPPHEVWAVKGVNLSVPSGRCIGIIGMNGAGKSTLLKLLTGVIRPTEGSLSLKGQTLALLELGTGFNNEISGRQNLFLTGALLGYSSSEIAAKVAAIQKFADIGDYFDQPVKTYSSGMFVRLAFSFYLHLEPEIFIVDEALSVGDFFFQQKCAAAMRRIKAAGVSILFVSHDTGAVQELADEVVLLEHGRITVRGDSNYVITHYHALDHGSKGAAPSLDRSRKAQPPSLDATTRHWLEKIRAADILGSRSSVGELGARILALRLIDACGRPASKVPSGGRLRIEAVIEARHDIAYANFGMLIADEQNRCIWSAASSNQNLWFGFMQDGDIAIASVEVTLDLAPGHYQINVQTGEVDPHDASFSVWNDARIHCAAIDVVASEHCNNRSGVGFLPMEISAL